MSGPTRTLPPTIRCPEPLDVDELFDRFEIFEALHDGLDIANPMSSSDLDAVVGLLAPSDGETVVDLACGTGELLLRLNAAAPVSGRGIDLSPWMLVRATAVAEDRRVGSLEWILRDARHDDGPIADIAACLGASWVWHGISGTVRALAERVRIGGRVAVGDMVRREEVSAETATASHGPTPGSTDVVDAFARNGIDAVGSIVTSDADWDRYLEATAAAVERWAQRHPGPRAERWMEEHAAWIADQARDREIMAWTVWVGRKTSHGVPRT